MTQRRFWIFRQSHREYAPMIFLPFLLPPLIFGTIALYIFCLMNFITRISNAIDANSK